MLLVLRASGRIKCCTVSTVHGPALDRAATVKEPFLGSITPTRSKQSCLINMLSLYRFSTIEQTVTLNRLPKEITKERGMQKHKKKNKQNNPSISNFVKR